jgi:hypothetical protein
VEQNETLGTWTFLVCRNLIGKGGLKGAKRGKRSATMEQHTAHLTKLPVEKRHIARDEIREQEQA